MEKFIYRNLYKSDKIPSNIEALIPSSNIILYSFLIKVRNDFEFELFLRIN